MARVVYEHPETMMLKWTDVEREYELVTLWCEQCHLPSQYANLRVGDTARCPHCQWLIDVPVIIPNAMYGRVFAYRVAIWLYSN